MNNNISQVIIEKRISQSELARLVGIRREYINRIIHKQITPTVPLWIRIAKALGVAVEDIFIL